MDASIRFRIAARIHHALVGELGMGIEVMRMLQADGYAHEVLSVCDACGKKDLTRLARHFRAATEQERLSTARQTRRGNGPEAPADGISSTGPRGPIAPSAASVAWIR